MKSRCSRPHILMTTCTTSLSTSTPQVATPLGEICASANSTKSRINFIAESGLREPSNVTVLLSWVVLDAFILYSSPHTSRYGFFIAAAIASRIHRALILPETVELTAPEVSPNDRAMVPPVTPHLSISILMYKGSMPRTVPPLPLLPLVFSTWLVIIGTVICWYADICQ